MAEEKKPDSAIDDWDSMPLDPNADDWDDEPGSSATAKAKKPEDVQPSHDPIEIEIEEDDHEADEHDFGTIDFDLPAFNETDIKSLNADENDSMDPFPDPMVTTGGGPEKKSVELDLGNFDNNRKQGSSTFDGDDDDESFNAHLAAVNIGQVFEEDVPEKEGLDSDDENKSGKPEKEPNDKEQSTKKVELDIDGIFLESADGEADGEGESVEDHQEQKDDHPQDVVEAISVALEDEGAHKIPKYKLLIIVIPSILVLLGLTFGIYKLFFSSPAPQEKPKVLIINPEVPPRELVPGEMALSPFYLTYPTSSGETVVEMSVILHYNDKTDIMVIDQNLTALRDAIFRLSSGKGAGLISDGETQRILRQELTEICNKILGAQRVSYVQINQLRILQ